MSVRTSSWPRLLLVTGKGGTGKSSLAQALVKAKRNQSPHIFLVDLQKSFAQTQTSLTKQELGINEKFFDFKSCLLEYMTRKLKSKLLAQGILATPFFLSLIQMLPGLKHVILMGSLLDYLEQHPDHFLVVDAWSSGHTLELIQAVHRFSEIFTLGMLKKDIDQLVAQMKQPESCSILVIGLLEKLILQETFELCELLVQSPLVVHHHLLINQVLPSVPAIPQGSSYWQQQLVAQQELLKQHFAATRLPSPYPELVPYVLSLEATVIEKELTEYFIKHFSLNSLNA